MLSSASARFLLYELEVLAVTEHAARPLDGAPKRKRPISPRESREERECLRSVSVSTNQSRKDRHNDNSQIKCKAPVLQIIDIVLDAFFD